MCCNDVMQRRKEITNDSIFPRKCSAVFSQFVNERGICIFLCFISFRSLYTYVCIYCCIFICILKPAICSHSVQRFRFVSLHSMDVELQQ